MYNNIEKYQRDLVYCATFFSSFSQMLKCYVGKIAHRQYNFLMFNVDQGEFKTYIFSIVHKKENLTCTSAYHHLTFLLIRNKPV